ncbi:Indoleamine 2,3-dioxygenase [Hesseltinella vesiculosa]|uniref:Indoleamine 2,3-dioxygenase n=1 Tax=Hesseltinella vesiculosa TaxID=101127 RepID=A0A1X2G338_9FUNG|nr:Indoleamine 2,3-dioxygenase [Hesseltinella vesiculosa]
MAIPMRSLEEYDIHPKTGFLPPEPPLRRLMDPYYEPWETMMDNFNGLLLAGKLRENIHKMPLLDHSKLVAVEEYRRAFLILCMLSHSYVWGKHEVASETLPSNLAVPWTAIADHLGLCPVVCHASVILWNYRLLDPQGPIDLSNLTTLATYSGSLDESWFYLVTTAIESAGGECPSHILSCIEHIRENNLDGVLQDLTIIRDGMEQVNHVLHRMFEKCDPYVFYWKIRPYLAGWENMAEAGLPLGVIYEGVDSIWHAETEEYGDISHLTEEQRLLRQYRRYAGGSAAQSSLIACFDVAFGVEHHPVGEKKSSNMPSSPVDPADRYRHLPSTRPADELDENGLATPASSGATTPRTPFKRTNRNSFLRAMRKYMPEPHHLEHAANIRPFMLQLEAKFYNDNALTDQEKDILDKYNACLHQLKLFRDKHVQIVSLYIVNQARKGPNIAHGGFAMEKPKEDSSKKTNGTAPIPISPSSSTNSLADTPPMTSPSTGRHNILYPQTALETNPGIHANSPSSKLTQLFPQLGLAKYVDPKTKVVRGTGGTNVMPFLKQSRDETADMKIALKSPQDPSNLPNDSAAADENEPKKSWSDVLWRR